VLASVVPTRNNRHTGSSGGVPGRRLSPPTAGILGEGMGQAVRAPRSVVRDLSRSGARSASNSAARRPTPSRTREDVCRLGKTPGRLTRLPCPPPPPRRAQGGLVNRTIWHVACVSPRRGSYTCRRLTPVIEGYP
jgi:hypothetical protein